MSQACLADQIGTCQSTYHAWENDQSLPNAEYFVRLAIVLQVDLRELIPADLRSQLPNPPVTVSTQPTNEELIRSLQLTINLLQEKNEALLTELNSLREQSFDK